MRERASRSERGTERKYGEKERNSQTDKRQTIRQGERHRSRQADRKAERQTDRQMERQTEGIATDRETGRQAREGKREQDKRLRLTHKKQEPRRKENKRNRNDKNHRTRG